MRFCTLILALLPFSAMAQEQPRAPGAPDIQVRRMQPLEFGQFTNDGAGTITIDPRSGGCRETGGITMVRANCSFATIEIRGEPDSEVLVELQPETTLQNNERSGEMTLRDFTMNLQNPVRLGQDGRAVVQIGATLASRGKVPHGGFNADYNITVTYKR